MKVGIQLFSVKEALAKNPKGTLKQVADLGYKYLEPIPCLAMRALSVCRCLWRRQRLS